MDSPYCADVIFQLASGERIMAHKTVLCAASSFFCRILGFYDAVANGTGIRDDGSYTPAAWEKAVSSMTHRGEPTSKLAASVNLKALNSGGIPGFAGLQVGSGPAGSDHGTIIIDLQADVPYSAFRQVIEFLYTGSCAAYCHDDSNSTSAGVKAGFSAPSFADVVRVATLFKCDDLATMAENARDGNAFLNASIGTFVNDTTASRAKRLFLQRDTFADVWFEVEGVLVPAHRCIVAARSNVLSAMLAPGRFAEGSVTTEVSLPGTTLAAFLPVLEYLYTAHAPVEGNEDIMEILATGDRFAQTQLVTLCELYASKMVEAALAESIQHADIDIVELVEAAQQYNAQQLAGFCLHYLATNYLAMQKRDEWARLDGDNKAYVEKHRWPPVAYLDQLAQYERTVGTQSASRGVTDGGCSIM